MMTELFEKDHIFDKFECSFNGTGTQIMTGSYNNYLHLYDVLTGEKHVTLMADKSIFLHKKSAVIYPPPPTLGLATSQIPLKSSISNSTSSLSTSKLNILRKKSKEPSPPLDLSILTGEPVSKDSPRKDLLTPANINPSKKILHAAWHPLENTMAIAAQNNLFIFYEAKTPSKQ